MAWVALSLARGQGLRTEPGGHMRSPGLVQARSRWKSTPWWAWQQVYATRSLNTEYSGLLPHVAVQEAMTPTSNVGACLYPNTNKYPNWIVILTREKGEKLAATFNARWAEQGAWQREFSFLLRLFSRWLKDNALLDSAVQDCLERLENRVRGSRVMVAFVAEFSRGKSEMVNAIFFADYGRRIMPASAGRTTMCPTEIAYDPDLAPTLRLLPIQTRLQAKALRDWRLNLDAWTTFVLDLNSAEQLASTFERVTETLQVTPQEAQALGFWDSPGPEDHPPTDAQGLVEVPKWRHALVNFAHPLLKQGLVILDTPGLNAVGAEPELTLDLIDQADAVVFIVGADTGVTASDLAIWQDHIRPCTDQGRTELLVLNKIDTLWDELRSPDQVQAQIEAQKRRAAEALGVDPQDVLAVSAQKGLVAKISSNADLLERSGLLALEAALAHGVVGGRRAALHIAVAQDIATLLAEVGRIVHTSQMGLAGQRAEVEGLRGKSDAVVQQMRERIAREQQEFERGSSKIRAVKAVHARLFQDIWDALDPSQLAHEINTLERALSQPGLKMGAKKAYGETFSRLRARLSQVQALANEIRAMQVATFHQINAELGTALQPLAPPALDACLMDLALTERSHLSYLGLRNLLRLQQPEFRQRLVVALESRLQTMRAGVRMDAQSWRNSVAAHLDAQIHLRRTHFANRLDALEKVGNATAGLHQRLRQLADRQQAMEALATKLEEQTAHLVAANEDHQAKLQARSLPPF